MEIGVEPKKQIEEIISKTKCRKNFECYKSGFANLTPVKKLGSEGLIECLGENPQMCEHSSSFGDGRFCKCPVRIYIAEKLGK